MMKKVRVNNIELTYVIKSKGVQFSNESKVKIVDVYKSLSDLSGSHAKEATPKLKFVKVLINAVPELTGRNPEVLRAQIVKWERNYENLTSGASFGTSHKEKKTVKVTLTSKIEDTNNNIQKLLAEVEKLKNDLSILTQAKELLGAE